VIELLPTKATFAPGEPVEIELRGAHDRVRVSLWRLDELVAETAVEPGESARFAAQPPGGYGVEAGEARSALDVLADPLSRARYGFVADYEAEREIADTSDNIRRLHLNAIQFYDWMYHHASLLPPSDDFEDSLGRRLSLASVRNLVDAVKGAGSLPLGYAAVYAAGRDEWPEWQDEGLYRANGTPWTLGEDFLWNVDPTNERWLRHFATELREAVEQVGFAGFHLDQYGAPKRALRADGTEVDLAAAFPALIDELARELPEARLVFNNVNDFPTWSTANAQQASIYIEVWSPHDRLGHLAGLVAKARGLAPEKSVILAAYLSVFAGGDEAAACAAQCLVLATVFSHGGTVLLHGEAHAVLTEAYYVRSRELSAESQAATRRYYDFAVRYGDLLFDRDAVDVTSTHLGGVNEEITVDAPVPVSVDSQRGALWVRAVRGPRGLLMSLIDLSPQTDDLWDAPKAPGRALDGVRVTIERTWPEPLRVYFADPDEQPSLRRLEPSSGQLRDTVAVPPFRTWALLWVPSEADA
jgi:dextranase